MALPPNAVNMLHDTEQSVSDLISGNLGVMPEGLDPDQQEEFRARQLAALQNADQAVSLVTDTQQEVGQVMNDAAAQLPAMASSLFSLERFAQEQFMQEPMMQEDPMMQDPMVQEEVQEDTVMGFTNHIDLFHWLEEQFTQGVDSSDIRSQLITIVGESEILDQNGFPIEPAEVVASELTNYTEALNSDKLEERASIAKRIFDVMPQKDTSENEVSVVEKTVAETNGILRRLASELANNQTKESSSGFNLSKVAQHKTVENVIMHGPVGNRIDPFTGYLINDWHVYERNKGWGLRAGDAIGIDYEALWRGNVMDKYSRPYRNKDGDWIGGYIQKRFEVDKFIPESNNLQLKPGQKRKPYVAEFASQEARLQDLRSKEDSRGRVFNDTSKPFNWKEAQSCKKKVNG